MFYDESECVMIDLGTTKHSSSSVLTLGNKVILYCLLVVSAEDICARSRTLKHSEEITCTVVKKKKQCEMNRPLVLDVCTETSNTQATWMQFSKRFKR